MIKWSLLFLASAIAGAPPSTDGGTVEPRDVTSAVIPKHVQLGQPFTYEVKVAHLKNERWDVKVPQNLGTFEWLEHSRSRSDGAADATTTFRMKMALFELGERKLPDLTFIVTNDDGARTFVVPGTEVEGISSLKESERTAAELKDIKPPEGVPVRSYRVLWYSLGALATAALAYAAYRWLKRPRIAVAPILVPKSAEVLALEALDALKSAELPKQGRIREYYFRLSEILRGYLGSRFSFEALECTSAELLTAMKLVRAPALSLPALEAFVVESDFVKFAKGEVGSAECDRDLQYAYSVIHQTSLAPAIPTDALRPHVS